MKYADISLWNEKSPLYPIANALQKKLVPDEGKAGTEHGELLRVATNVYYDVHNNGGCNIKSLAMLEALDTILSFENEIVPLMDAPCPTAIFKTAILCLKNSESDSMSLDDDYPDDEYDTDFFEEVMVGIIKYVANEEGMEYAPIRDIEIVTVCEEDLINAGFEVALITEQQMLDLKKQLSKYYDETFTEVLADMAEQVGMVKV